MRQIVQCAPNFSEGRREEVLGRIVEAVRACGVEVLDAQADPELNRSVVTFLGDLQSVERAAFAAAARAAELIDMGAHRGGHPRIGATDVIPFVPVAGASLGDCVDLARRVGRRLGSELGLPVYLYGEAATRPERASPAAIRAGEYEGLRDRIAEDPELEPDYGPRRIGPAGAVAVGARHPMAAVQVRLGTGRLDVADAVARTVREDSGGLRHVQAEGVAVDDDGALVAVAASVLRPDQTPLHRLLEAIRREAGRYGVPVRGVEIRGWVPQSILTAAAEWYLQLDGFDPDAILENRLLAAEASTSEGSIAPLDFVDAVGAEAATPGGGSVAALAGALGAALNRMVASLTIGREKYSAAEAEMIRLRARALELQQTLLELIDLDAEAFQAVMEAYRMPHRTGEEAERRREMIQSTLRRATEVPLETMRQAAEVLRLARTAAELGNATAVSDAGVSAFMAFAATRSASLNVEINVRGLRDLEEGDRYRQESQRLLRDAQVMVDETDRTVRARIAGQ